MTQKNRTSFMNDPLGEILIDDEVQSLALRNLWKTLCIDSIKLSDLEFIEVEVHKQKKVIQETKSSLIQRIENNVNNGTTPLSLIQVNLFQKGSFLHQLTHNMTTDCSLIYDFLSRKIQVQNMLCTKIVFCTCIFLGKKL